MLVGALKEAAQILFSDYRDDQEAEELAALVNAVNGDGDTALHFLCKNPNIKGEALTELLDTLEKSGADLTMKDHAGQTALHIICSRKGEIPAVQYLTSSNRGDNKPNVNAKDSLGYTAMYRSLVVSDPNMYNYLSEDRGANINIKRDDSKDEEEILEDGYPNTAQALMNLYNKNEASLSNVRDNIINGDLERVRAAITTDPGLINIFDKSGNSLLHIAVSNNKQDMVNLLVEKGANILLPNYAGSTPLDLAGNKIMIESLLKGDKAIREYRAKQDDNLKEKSYYSGVVAATGAAVVGSHIINYPKDLAVFWQQELPL